MEVAVNGKGVFLIQFLRLYSQITATVNTSRPTRPNIALTMNNKTDRNMLLKRFLSALNLSLYFSFWGLRPQTP